jgi:hypothetical protein
MRYQEQMAAKRKSTQTTSKGHEIPVPKRGDFFKDLKKAATQSRTRSKKKK